MEQAQAIVIASKLDEWHADLGKLLVPVISTIAGAGD